jgi:tetratricopeptide (TPR) repeat protein
MAQLLVGTGVVLATMASLRADDPLKEVDRLYSTAAYEEALAATAKVDDLATIDQVDEYRALCLLALERDADAEHAVERLVARHPLGLDGLNEQAPKFMAVYRAVRARLVPELANKAYHSGLASFEAKDYAAADDHFGEALELLHSVDVPASRGDWELLASEFRVLARLRSAPVEPQPVLQSTPMPAAVAPFPAGEPILSATLVSSPVVELNPMEPGASSRSAEPITPPTAVSSPAAEPVVPAPFAPVPRVYDRTDLDVTPPVEINRTMPPWNPPFVQVANRTYAGELQLVIGKDGRIRSVEILKPAFGPYDGLLLRAMKQWQYGPALKRGFPVEYRQTFEYALRPADQGKVPTGDVVSGR